jgi:D-tyrosyl-tRNA(Tyr) deacylase
MKVVVQRVVCAECNINHQMVSQINQGFLLLVGFCDGDTSAKVKQAAKKIANLRVFEDEAGKMNKSILDCQGEILLISQFTLCADTSGGNRPSFINALHPDQATILYDELTSEFRNHYHIFVQVGVFGGDMKIGLINDGPVTIFLEF